MGHLGGTRLIQPQGQTPQSTSPPRVASSFIILVQDCFKDLVLMGGFFVCLFLFSATLTYAQAQHLTTICKSADIFAHCLCQTL